MTEQFLFQSDFSKVNQAQVLRILRQRRLGWPISPTIMDWLLRGSLFAFGVIAAIGLIEFMREIIGNTTPWADEIVLGSVFLFSCLLFLRGRRRRKLAQILKESPARNGVMHFTLSPDQLDVAINGFQGRYTWGMFQDAIATPTALLFLLSDYEYLAIEAGAFDNMPQMEQVASVAKGWITKNAVDYTFA